MVWFMLGRTRFQAGNITAAESACRRALTLQPNMIEAHLLLGTLLESGNNTNEAEACYRTVLELAPGNFDGHARLGMLMQNQGILDDAREYYQQALALNPNLPLVHFNLGTVLQELNELSEAEASYRSAIQFKPDYGKAYANLGYVLRIQGKREEAVAAYQQALRCEPDTAKIHYNLGLLLQELERADEAEQCQQTAIRLKPDYAEAHGSLGQLFQIKGDYTKAEASYKQAIKIKPDYAAAYHGLAVALNAMGRQAEAPAFCKEALRIRPDYVDAHIALAAALMALQQPDKALEHCNRALELEPDNINAIALNANIAIHTGDKDQAFDKLRPVLEKGLDDAGSDHLNAILAFSLVSKDLGRMDEAIQLMEQMLKQVHGASSRRSLHFNLGKLYDATGEYDKAFTHYQQGNESKPLTFDPNRHAAEVETIINTYTPDFMMRMPRATVRSNRPVFVVGMPRSGTSLVEQILASHPDVFGAGELPDIVLLPMSMHIALGTDRHYPQCLPLLTREKLDKFAQNYLDHLQELSADSTRVIDKMPGNFMHLGLIELMFPDARVIHCMRNPLDTCLSCYFQDFSRSHPYSYDFSNLAAFYKGYLKIMQHWRSLLSIPMIEVQYEETVANQEAVSRSMVEFCGLEWDDRCLQFHKTRRYVGTASYEQVRQPIYKNSAGRWKNYEPYIDTLRKELES